MEEINFRSIVAIANSYDDALTINKILYKMTGDLECAVILSRLLYWFSPGKNGKTRTRVLRDGFRWVARKDEDWEEEACVRKKQMPRIKRDLVKLGVVIVQTYKFDGAPTTHWHLDVEQFTKLYNETLKKMISKTLNGEFRNPSTGDFENPQRGKTTNIVLSQDRYAASLNTQSGFPDESENPDCVDQDQEKDGVAREHVRHKEKPTTVAECAKVYRLTESQTRCLDWLVSLKLTEDVPKLAYWAKQRERANLEVWYEEAKQNGRNVFKYMKSLVDNKTPIQPNTHKKNKETATLFQKIYGKTRLIIKELYAIVLNENGAEKEAYYSIASETFADILEQNLGQI